MSLLSRKLNHDQESPPLGRPRGKRMPRSPSKHTLCACCQEDPKVPKTAWEYYNEGTEIIDRERERDWLVEMDTAIILAGLFAAVLSAFLIQLLGRLEQNPMDIIQDVLIYQTHMMRNSSLEPYVPVEFSPPEYIVYVNALLYASLGVTLLVAFFAILIRAWVRQFAHRLRAISDPEQRAKTREFRYLGMMRWKLPSMIGILPLLILVSLLLLSVGILLLLFHISTPSFLVTTSIFGVGVVFYAVTASISVYSTSSPLHSPLSRALGETYRNLYAYFCPSAMVFLVSHFDATPATALGRLRMRIQIFLLKLRPYDEQDFVEPIGATTMDEVQLSTAASALQRIHDSAPNSQHSETLQSSVWQIAGSPTLRIPPFFRLPSWIYERVDDQEYLMSLPPDKVVALVATSLRMGDKWVIKRLSAAKSVLQPMDLSRSPWDRLVYWVFNLVLESGPHDDDPIQAKSKGLISTLHWNELHEEETIWLLNTLSDIHSRIWLKQGGPFFIGSCLGILSSRAPGWSIRTRPNIALLEAVVAFAAISCSSDITYRRKILTNSRQTPWLLLNLRNPELIRNVIEGAPNSCHKQLISLLFLVSYALMLRRLYRLIPQCFSIITAKGDFCLYTSALTAIAPAIGEAGLSTIGRMLVAPQTQNLRSIIFSSIRWEKHDVQEELLQNYDHRLGASENPDPNMFAILLLLSKQLPSSVVNQLHDLDLKLKNPWLKLAARVIARLDIPDGSNIYTGSFHDHRVRNMIAALSLRRYAEAKPTQYTESLLLASFLGSREPSVSALALEYYIQTILSYSDPSAPSFHFPGAVRAVFNLLLPDHQLQMGWNILDMFVNGFERLSVEWRRTFANAFFTSSCRLLPKFRGDRETSTAESELEKILTWEYFHEEERKSEFTDSRFSGLDWMVMAWSLHLSQQSKTMMEQSSKGEARPQGSGAPVVNEGFVLCALYKLLDAASFQQIIPIVPKLREFVQWFEDAELSEYYSRIGARIEEGDHKGQEYQMIHKFHAFHCMWYI